MHNVISRIFAEKRNIFRGNQDTWTLFLECQFIKLVSQSDVQCPILLLVEILPEICLKFLQFQMTSMPSQQKMNLYSPYCAFCVVLQQSTSLLNFLISSTIITSIQLTSSFNPFPSLGVLDPSHGVVQQSHRPVPVPRRPIEQGHLRTETQATSSSCYSLGLQLYVSTRRFVCLAHTQRCTCPTFLTHPCLVGSYYRTLKPWGLFMRSFQQSQYCSCPRRTQNQGPLKTGTRPRAQSRHLSSWGC